MQVSLVAVEAALADATIALVVLHQADQALDMDIAQRDVDQGVGLRHQTHGVQPAGQVAEQPIGQAMLAGIGPEANEGSFVGHGVGRRDAAQAAARRPIANGLFQPGRG